MESEDDIVLVHYLNIAQRQQAGRQTRHNDCKQQIKSDERDSGSHSDPQDSDDHSRSSDPKPALQAVPSPVTSLALQAQGLTAAPGDVAESCMLAQASSEALIQLIPSLSSMDMLFSATDSKLSIDGSKVSGEDALRSNAAVQELLRTWEEENAQECWQVCSKCLLTACLMFSCLQVPCTVVAFIRRHASVVVR